MSRINNIKTSYGNSFEIAVANTYSYNVMNATSLLSNSIIFSSPKDNDGNDIGAFSIMCTDNDGNPVRITYAVVEGNGLYADNDKLKLNLDKSLQENLNGELSLKLENIVDNTFSVDSKKIKLNIDSFPKASKTKLGIVKPDNLTIKANNGKINVDTSNLDLADNSIQGICIGDNITIKTINGNVELISNGLEKCSNTTYGVLKPDNVSIVSDNGTLSMNTAYLKNDDFGSLCKIDDSLVSDEGTISININSLQKATYSTPGIVSLGNEFVVNQNGQVTLHAQSNLDSNINDLQSRIDSLDNRLTVIENAVLNN